MLSKAIETLEKEIASLKEQTAREINDIYTYLIRHRARIKLWPRISQYKGYSTFSIIWRKVDFYDWKQKRATSFQDIRKARNCHLVPKARLMFRCRGCASWEKEYIWQKELEFSRTRKRVALLSRTISALKQFIVMTPSPEVQDQAEITTFMEVNEIGNLLLAAQNNLKQRIGQTVAEVNRRLDEEGRTEIRPRTGDGKEFEFMVVEWFKPNGGDPASGRPTSRELPRERKYSIGKGRLLAHCRDSEDWEKEFVWEKEMEFALLRRQAARLNQTITAMKQYTEEYLKI